MFGETLQDIFDEFYSQDKKRQQEIEKRDLLDEIDDLYALNGALEEKVCDYNSEIDYLKTENRRLQEQLSESKEKYLPRLDFVKLFPENVRKSREFYIRMCSSEEMVNLIFELINWNKIIPGVTMENTDDENKKLITKWLQEEHR